MRCRPALVVGLALLAPACGGHANKATGARQVKPVVLSLANWEEPEGDVGDWMHAVARLSHGSVRIDARGEWRRDEPNSERATLADVRAGRVDLAHIPGRAWDTLGISAFRAVQTPLLVDSLAWEERILRSDAGARMLASLRAAGVEPIALVPGPLRYPAGITRDLRGAHDFRDARLALPTSALESSAARALGAKVAPAAADAVDGRELDLTSLDNRDDRPRSVTADVVLWPRVTTIVMNPSVWLRLAPAQRAVLRDAARAAIAPAMRRLRTAARGSAASLCERGVTFIDAGPTGAASLRRALAPLLRDLAGDPLLPRVRQLGRNVPRDPPPRCGARALPRGPVDPRLVGRWHVTMSRALLVAAGDASADENWGGITLALQHDGSFELRNDRFAPLAGFGTWSAKGDQLVFHFDGTYAMGRGETSHYRWTLFRGALALRRLGEGPMVLSLGTLHRR